MAIARLRCSNGASRRVMSATDAAAQALTQSLSPCRFPRDRFKQIMQWQPFHYQEVAARIRAVLRRRDSRREGPRRIGDLFIDPSRREVRVGDREVNLANKEFSLLRALAADP